MDTFTSLSQFAASHYADNFLVATAANTIMGVILIPLIITLAVSVFMIICIWKIFKKAGKGGWESIIPVYNFIVMLQITELPMWYIALLFVPIAQVYALIKINIELAKKFGQEGGFAALLILVPVVGYPILAFGKDKVYMGGGQNINNDYAQQGYQQTQYAQPQYGQPQPQYNQPMQQPGTTQQPMQQPIQQPKAPMDPAKKKKIIMWCCIGGGVLVLGIVAAIVLPIILRVDYSTAYTTAKKLEDKVYAIYQNYDCGYVTDYVTSTYTTTKRYNEYIEKCKAVFDNETNSLIGQLGNTDGVKRNSEISDRFNAFKTVYDSILPDSTDLESKLSAYQDWHNFAVALDNMSYSNSSDAEFTTAANYLISSSNPTLKTYGESWLEHQKVYVKAYRDYDNTSYSASNKSALRIERDNKKKELDDWISANKPDIKSLVPLKFDDTSKLNSAFNSLYELIKTNYEQNYNYDSGDCMEFLGKVVCD